MATDSVPALAGYRNAVTELVQADKPFGDIEEAIDAVADITREEKASLWLFAFSLRDRHRQQGQAGVQTAPAQ
jgi:hypothetical protein